MSSKRIVVILMGLIILVSALYLYKVEAYKKISPKEGITEKGQYTKAPENMQNLGESDIADEEPNNKADIVQEKDKSEKISEKQPEGIENNMNDESKEAKSPKKEIKNYIVCIDPGHQKKGNYSKEPIGPNSSTLKAKVSSGTRGVSTQIPEYKLNLEVSMLLKKELENQGYKVVMTREKNDVDISNKEMAEVANTAKADIFLRIHADGSSSSKTNGISVLCPSKNNQYTKEIYEKSNKLANSMVRELVASTASKSNGIAYRDDISGFNWSKVPVILIEMGFMTNAQEDEKLSTKEYQAKIVKGIVNGLSEYFNSNEEEK